MSLPGKWYVIEPDTLNAEMYLTRKDAEERAKSRCILEKTEGYIVAKGVAITVAHRDGDVLECIDVDVLGFKGKERPI